MLIEAAWSYRYPPRVAKEEAEIVVRLPKLVRDMAVKGRNGLMRRGDRMHLTY
jgi:transposase